MTGGDGFLVTERIDGAHPNHAHYPLLPGDLLTRDDAGTWAKEAPGLMVIGFTLTAEQEATLEPRRFHRHGLGYCIEPAEGLAPEPRVSADHGEWGIRIYDDQYVPEGKTYAPDNRVVVLRHGNQVREFLYPAYRIWTLLAHWTAGLDDLAHTLDAREDQVEAAEDRADQVAYDAARERE